jgi:hypothetical protein
MNRNRHQRHRTNKGDTPHLPQDKKARPALFMNVSTALVDPLRYASFVKCFPFWIQSLHSPETFHASFASRLVLHASLQRFEFPF